MLCANNRPLFIQLAGPELLSLKIMPDKGMQYQEMRLGTVAAIAKLSALTRLELTGYKCTARLTALQRLKLQELSLDSSPGAAEAILLPGAMTTLQKLHLSEGFGEIFDQAAFQNDLADTDSEGHQRAQQLHQLGQVLFGLPSLVEVSGSCCLFTCAMAEGLKDWSVWQQKYIVFDECVWKKRN